MHVVAFRFLVLALATAPACTSAESSRDDPPDAAPQVDGAPVPGFCEASPFGDASVEDVRFDTGGTGFAALSDTDLRGLYRTDDGGGTWRRLDVSVMPYGVAFAPGLGRLWAVGNGPAYASVDGGMSFMPLMLPSDFYGSAALWDDMTGVVTSETGDRVHRTVDGGATWETHAFTREVLPGTRRIATRGDDLWIVGGPTARSDGAHVAHSPDRGASWEVFQLADEAHDREGGTLLAVAALSATDVWVAGENRQVFHTVDGFASWTQLRGLPAQILHVGAIAAAGSTIRIAVTLTTHGYAIYESADGGTSFDRVEDLTSEPWDAQGIAGMTALPAGGYVVYGYAGLYCVHR